MIALADHAACLDRDRELLVADAEADERMRLTPLPVAPAAHRKGLDEEIQRVQVLQAERPIVIGLVEIPRAAVMIIADVVDRHPLAARVQRDVRQHRVLGTPGFVVGRLFG